MKHYAILLGSIAAFFLALFGIVEALHLPLLTDPGPWFTSKTLRTALLGVGLLVADVLLPIPSSLVMIAHGLCFGFAVGALLSLVGSVGAGLVAFSLGRYGHPLLRRLIPPAEKRHADALFARWGALAILVTRPIPILAETMAILAGASPISWQRMVLATVLHINTREELINALHEAIQIEHGLMLQYLYAALSCKRFPYEGLDDRQTEVVRDWEGRLLKIARDEMAHLATACNLLNAIGGTPNFARPHFPQPKGRWFPFNFQLEKLNTASLRRFVRAESPPPLMEAQLRGIAPDPIDYDYVGELYRSISSGFETLETQGIDLFIGAPEVQDSSDWSGNLRIFPIRDVASAQAAIEFIVRQGEGTPAGQTGTHFAEFNALLAALQAEQQRDARFDPARNIVANPLTRPQRDAGKGAFVIAQASLAHPVAELCNHVYSTLLMLLTQFFDPVGETRQQRDIIQAAARRAMSGIVRPLAEVLTTLPATADASGPHAAAPFEIYGDLRLPAYPRARWTLLIERTTLEAAECLKLATMDERLTRLTFIGRNLELLQSTITAASTEGASQ